MSLTSASQLRTQPQEESELLPCSWQPVLLELGIWAARGRGGRPDQAGFASICLQLLSGLSAVRRDGGLCRSLPSFSICSTGERMAGHSPVSGRQWVGWGFPRKPRRGREDLQWPRARDQDTLCNPGLVGKSNLHSLSSRLPSSAWLLQAEMDV